MGGGETEMNYEAFYGTHVDNLKSNGRQAYGRCPFHDDRRASLSINLFTGQFNCHGCGLTGNHITFSRRLGLPYPTEGALSPAPARRSPAPQSQAPLERAGEAEGPKAPFKSRVIAEYVYTDEEGRPLTKVLRTDPKGFMQMRWTGSGWAPGLQDARRVPYRLDKVVRATDAVYVVEGEKDVETLEKQGLTASTTAMGAGGWREEYAAPFRDKYVVILPDNDEPGRKYAETAARDIVRARGHVKLVHLPGLPEHADVTDYFERGGTKADLLALVKATAAWSETPAAVESPKDYLEKIGVLVPDLRVLVPSEIRPKIRELILDVIDKCQTLNEAAQACLDEIDKQARRCTTPNEFARLTTNLKRLHEVAK